MLNRKITLLFGIIAIMLLVVACSDDSTTPTNSSNPITQNIRFADYAQIIGEIAPPIYQPTALKPDTIDPTWDSGQYALLGKVFSENESMSLYSNLNTFDEMISRLDTLLQVDTAGNLLIDTSMMTMTTLSSPTTIPAYAQNIIGTNVNVGTLLDLHFPDMTSGAVVQVGFTHSDTVENILLFEKMLVDGQSTYYETSLFYASFDPVDSSILMQGVFYKATSDTSSARWVYDIHSVNDADFAYRMSWYADRETVEMPASLLGCIVGGGNRDTEFALRYRQYMPADTSVVDSTYLLDQVFGPNYTEGTGLISSYAAYVDEGLIFHYSDMPGALLASPWANK